MALEDVFFHYRQSSRQYLLKLSTTTLSIAENLDEQNPKLSSSSENDVQLISIDDIYGCSCMKSTKNPNQCFIIFYIYLLKRSKSISGIFSKKRNFHRIQRTFVYGKYDDYETNYAEVMRWHQNVTDAIYLRRNLPVDIITTKRDKRALVLVNPAGGSGKAYRLVMEHVVDIWREAEFNYQIIVTEYAGHAREYVKSLDLTEWNGIVVASGDGLVYEVINGLFDRSDWQEAIKMPIGHLPGGSGNAFIANIIRDSKQPIETSTEKFLAQSAIFIATHQVIPFDLAVVDLCDGQRVFSFLSIAWGVVADVDYESEKYRCLGETRFTIEATKRILRPRTYHGYVDYLPYEENSSSNQITSDIPTSQLHQNLLPINEPIPMDSSESKWRRIDGPFAHVLVTSKAAISKDSISTPQSTLADGYLTLQFIRSAGLTRVNLAKAFLGLSDGKHMNYDFVEWMRVRAFRIVPVEKNGNMMVDGEKVPYGPIQGEILPHMGRCMGKQPRSD